MECTSIEDLLSELKYTATQIRKNRAFCRKIKNQLRENGYDWFDYTCRGGGSGRDQSAIADYFPNDCEQVMKVFATAVNDAMKKKVGINYFECDDLEELLQNDERKSLQLRKCFELDNMFKDTRIYSPLEMANHLKKGRPQWFVANLIQRQFDISWDTITGEPDDYTFYDFCDSENTRDFFKYIPRQAHVKATLYKECRVKNVGTLRAITEKQLCPKVYIRTMEGWKTWQADAHTWEDGNVQDLKWMDKSILNFIKENADEQTNTRIALKDTLKKPTLYWAVLQDSDFTSGEELELNEIGETQVYVGKASNGIKGRWCDDSDSHCKMMSTCLRNVCAMTSYEPSSLDGIALVDARLTLAKVRREKTALFVIKTFGDDVEKAKRAEHKAKEEMDHAKMQYDEAEAEGEELINEEQTLNECEEKYELACQATEELDALKKRSRKKAIAKLEDAERLHREGKKIQNRNRNVIPTCATWTPKKMEFGMNKN